MMIGVAYLEQGMHAEALEAFENVREIGNDQERENAEQWIEFVEEKQAFQAQVSASQ